MADEIWLRPGARTPLHLPWLRQHTRPGRRVGAPRCARPRRHWEPAKPSAVGQHRALPAREGRFPARPPGPPELGVRGEGGELGAGTGGGGHGSASGPPGSAPKKQPLGEDSRAHQSLARADAERRSLPGKPVPPRTKGSPPPYGEPERLSPAAAPQTQTRRGAAPGDAPSALP